MKRGVNYAIFHITDKARAITNYIVCAAHKMIFKVLCIFSAHSYFQQISSKILNGDLAS